MTTPDLPQLAAMPVDSPVDTSSGQTRMITRRALLRRGAYLAAATAGGLTLAMTTDAFGSSRFPAKLGIPRTAGYPAWLPAGLAYTYNTEYDVYNYKASNTSRHLAGLQDAYAKLTSCHEVFIGDSSTDGYTGAGYDRAASWPMVYRTRLAAYGIPVGGAGWVRAGDALGVDPRWDLINGWANDASFSYAASVGARATYTEPIAGTSVAVMFSAFAGAGFVVSVDGATSGAGFTTWSSATSTTNPVIITLDGLTDEPHTVELVTTSPAVLAVAAATVYTPDRGLIVDNVAQGGSTATGTTGATSWSDYASAGSPAYIFGSTARYPQTPSTVWITLGANDVHQGTPADTVTEAIASVAAHFPDSDVFLVLEYQANFVTTAAWTDYAQSLYRLADTLDVPLFDQWARIGSYPTYAAEGLAGDAVAHLDVAGYAVIGEWVASIAIT